MTQQDEPGQDEPGQDAPPGVDLARLTSWLDEQAPGLRQGSLSAQLITGGRSNLTYRLSDDHQHWALRRPPLGHVLPTAHDMAREFKVISALHGSQVPVPKPVALCQDPDVLGEPFYLMSFVEGVVIERPELVPDQTTATRITEQLVDTLVALHGIAANDIGLADFGRPDGYLQRQVARWHRQFQASVPAGHQQEQQVVGALQAEIPTGGRAGIVHGDYRLTNVLFDRQLTGIEAVVDWEMATLGDPLTDLGLLYVYHERAAGTDTVMPNFPSEQGFLSPQRMIARYAERAGQQLAELDWYIAFGYFKLGVIAAGIHARYLQGLTVGAGFEVFGTLRDSTLAAAAARLNEAGV
ncbi:MAG TPA: phosphotransferase family protein [Jatrophihabitans sp.]|nr:phosphotransferase family protein [Jatrophihabitans sp.]